MCSAGISIASTRNVVFAFTRIECASLQKEQRVFFLFEYSVEGLSNVMDDDENGRGGRICVLNITN